MIIQNRFIGVYVGAVRCKPYIKDVSFIYFRQLTVVFSGLVNCESVNFVRQEQISSTFLSNHISPFSCVVVRKKNMIICKFVGILQQAFYKTCSWVDSRAASMYRCTRLASCSFQPKIYKFGTKIQTMKSMNKEMILVEDFIDSLF